MIGDDVPEQPMVISDPRDHSMGKSVSLYVEKRVHELVDSGPYRKITVVGSYDRSLVVSSKEKVDKRQNWQRPTAELRGDELRIHCFPGRAYVFHYGSLIATHLSLTRRDPGIVRITLPAPEVCESEIARSRIGSLEATPVVVVASGNDHLDPAGVIWTDHGTFSTRRERVGDVWVTWLAVKHSFWGDIAYHLGRVLALTGFSRVVFVGKLGSLVPEHKPNITLATGETSLIGTTEISWSGRFRPRNDGSIVSGRHITLPSVLQETVAWRNQVRSSAEFVDPEIGNMAAGVTESGSEFSYLHIVSDNLSKQYGYDLSNERATQVLERRAASYSRIGDVLRADLSRAISDY